MNQGQASTPASASSSSTQQLNGDASQFHPNQYLMHNSIRDGPVIVSSTGERTSTAASGLKITPAPIGTRSQDMTVAKPAVFTTDTGPGVPGGHYLRTKVKDAREVPHWMAELERNVSDAVPISPACTVADPSVVRLESQGDGSGGRSLREQCARPGTLPSL